MARSELASMLDELMGKHRNAMPDEKPPPVKFTDDEVCKHFLCGFCPHDLFTNTKSDLGQCGGLHDEKLKGEYQASERYEKLGFEDQFLAYLQKLNGDMQRRVTKNKQRLELTQPNGQVPNSERDSLQQKIDGLTETINTLIESAEVLGAEGKVDEARQVVEKCDRLKLERSTAAKELENSVNNAEQKLMEVCDVCGCFLIVGDAPQRVTEHLTGKQHMGYAKIKVTIEELIRRKEEKMGGGGKSDGRKSLGAAGGDSANGAGSTSSCRKGSHDSSRRVSRRSSSRDRDHHKHSERNKWRRSNSKDRSSRRSDRRDGPSSRKRSRSNDRSSRRRRSRSRSRDRKRRRSSRSKSRDRHRDRKSHRRSSKSPRPTSRSRDDKSHRKRASSSKSPRRENVASTSLNDATHHEGNKKLNTSVDTKTRNGTDSDDAPAHETEKPRSGAVISGNGSDHDSDALQIDENNIGTRNSKNTSHSGQTNEESDIKNNDQ